ncbi:MAG: protein kinase [Candidatus Acidiferrales bacterium]
MTLTAGTKLGAYEILAAIGAGGMGEVYRAHDSKLGRDVAIKVLPDAFARDSERMARFQREAKLLASLNHPNIAAIYGFEDSGATHALVMELVEGPTLADRLKAGPIPIDEALRIAKQICEALEYAHERGIVHRDLKPANVKVTPDDAVKVLDFGLAKAIEGDASSMDIANSPTISRLATQAGVILGTAAYMSPEQAKGRPVDRRADIWAFGCVLYEMLTGKHAFGGETVTDTLAAVIRAEPDWSQLPTNTPTRVRVLLQRCLQKDAKQRLQAIGDARISLDEVLSGAQEPSSATAAATKPMPVWRRALPWALFGVTASALLVLGWWAYVRTGNAAPRAELVNFEIPMPQKAALVESSGFAISPNGRKLAFFATNPDGTNGLWIRDMGSSEARPVAGTESSADVPFFWSADSRYIAWDAGGRLKKIDISSGVVQSLCDLPLIEIGGSWNRDGVIIFGQGAGGLMRVSANGGSASPLTTLDSSHGEIQQVVPSFLPDGSHFIYLRVSNDQANSGIYVGSLDAAPGKQSLKRLLATTFGAQYVPSSSDPDTGQLLFLASDGTLMAQPFDARQLELTGEPVPVARQVGSYINGGDFSASANGVLVYRAAAADAATQLTWFDRQGKVLGTEGAPGGYYSPALSPDGTMAVVGRGPSIENLSLWLFDFSRSTNTRFTFDSSDANYPIWSPDGSRVIFESDPSGVFDLYQKPSSGTTGEQILLKSSENKSPSDISRDGRFLLYTPLDPKTGYDIWALPLQGDRKPFPFLRTKSNELGGHFSMDGHWVAYVSDESGRDEIYVRPFSPDSNVADASGAGAKWQVSYGGGQAPQWSTDGKELYYLTPDWKVMEVDVTTSPNFRAGTPKLLFQAPQQFRASAGAYTADGKKFLFLAPTAKGSQAQAPFNVVLNWQATLRPSAQN